jgi:hypothetical protein
MFLGSYTWLLAHFWMAVAIAALLMVETSSSCRRRISCYFFSGANELSKQAATTAAEQPQLQQDVTSVTRPGHAWFMQITEGVVAAIAEAERQ